MPQSGPDILVFPPIVALGAPIVAVVLEGLVPLADVLRGTAVQVILGGAICVRAVMLVIAAARVMRAADTDISPRKDTSLLVTDPPFDRVRNPIYLAMVMLQLGIALALSLEWGLIMSVVVWAILHWGVVRPEERYLSARFGADYDAYVASTRRWI